MFFGKETSRFGSSFKIQCVATGEGRTGLCRLVVFSFYWTQYVGMFWHLCVRFLESRNCRVPGRKLGGKVFTRNLLKLKTMSLMLLNRTEEDRGSKDRDSGCWEELISSVNRHSTLYYISSVGGCQVEVKGGTSFRASRRKAGGQRQTKVGRFPRINGRHPGCLVAGTAGRIIPKPEGAFIYQESARYGVITYGAVRRNTKSPIDSTFMVSQCS